MPPPPSATDTHMATYPDRPILPQRAVETLPVCRAADLPETPSEQRWLIRDLWTRQGCGFLAGHPKSNKSWLALDLALSIASASSALGHFAVDDPGPVLLFLAEDSLSELRHRLSALPHHRRLALAALPIHVITAPALRLDLLEDQSRLEATVEQLSPKLLLLDPLVRLHCRDENSSTEIALLLAMLRRLQRRHTTAVLLVHHCRKRSHPRLGQALRGSGDLWAWSDDNAYLVRHPDHLQLTLEHRSAAAPEPLSLRFHSAPDTSSAHFEVLTPTAALSTPATTGTRAACTTASPAPPRLDDQVLALLQRLAPRPLTRDELRRELRINNQRLGDTLRTLERQEHIERTPSGWRLSPTPLLPFPPSHPKLP